MSLLRRLARLMEWLCEDADQMWKDATLQERYEENQRRDATGRLLLGER